MTDNRLTAKDMQDLSATELGSVLNKQIAKHRSLNDLLVATKAQMSEITQNIGNLKSWISRLSPRSAPVHVTDHAVIRYLERVCGLNLDPVRQAIDSPELRECVQRCATGRHTINGITYVTTDKALVTIIYDGEPRSDAAVPELRGQP